MEGRREKTKITEARGGEKGKTRHSTLKLQKPTEYDLWPIHQEGTHTKISQVILCFVGAQ